MKTIFLAGTLSLGAALALSGCATDNSAAIPTPTPGPGPSALSQHISIKQPSVTGNVLIRQRIALPPDAILTVTLADASLADAPSKVLSQRVMRTDGRQPPYHFELPFKPADIKPNANILLSAAITVKDKLWFITDTVQPVINNGPKQTDLLLVPVQHKAMPVAQ